ncbi:MAG: four helix bundle protein [Bdellovibrionales bacterium]
MTMQSYKDLDVWRRSMGLVESVYLLTKQFPKEELYILTSQIRRAAISVPSNIAEGRSKRSTRDYMRFVHISYGSMAELETQLMISQRLGYASQDRIEPIIAEIGEIGRMLNGLLSGLERKLSYLPPES